MLETCCSPELPSQRNLTTIGLGAAPVLPLGGRRLRPREAEHALDGRPRGPKRARPMADPILHFERDFGHGAPIARDFEDGIIAESSDAARLICDDALAYAFKRLDPAVGRRERDHGAVARRPAGR